MKKRSLLILLSAILVICLVIPITACTAQEEPQPSPSTAPSTAPTAPSSTASAPSVETFKWQAQAGMSAKSYSYLYQYQAFAERVNANANGRLEIELFAPGAIVDAYDQFDAVKRGAIDIGMGVGGYNLKHIPAAAVEQGVPGTLKDTFEAVDFLNYYEGGKAYQILQKAYQDEGTFLLQSFGCSPLVLISREPLKSVEDIAGMKIRGSGSAPALITNLGGSPVTMAPSEVFMALQTGTIDGVIFPSYTIGSMKLWDAAKGIMGPSFGQTAGDIYVNLEKWNALPSDLQWIVKEAALYANHYYQATVERKIKVIMAEAVADHGVTIVNLSDKEFEKVVGASQSILDEEAAKSPVSAELVQLLRKYMAGE